MLYFNLIPSDKDVDETPIVTFTPTRPENVKWESSEIQIDCPPTSPVRLCVTSVCAPHPSGSPLPWAGHTILGASVPLMKSVIQKAIRRSLAACAVGWSWQLLKKDPTAFFRRLPIYVMEDALLHPEFAWTLWLMIATSKGWKPSESDVRRCLRIVYECARCPVHEHIPKELPTECVQEPSLCGDDSNDNPYNYNVDIVALLLRRAYGGMPGDQAFLRGFAGVWWTRGKYAASQIPQGSSHPAGLPWNTYIAQIWIAPLRVSGDPSAVDFIYDQAFDTLDNLHPDLWVGVDFHCYPTMPKEIIQMMGGNAHVTQAEVKQTIWLHSSGVYLITNDSSAQKPYINGIEAAIVQPSEQSTNERLQTAEIWTRIQDHVKKYQREKWSKEMGQRVQTSIGDFFAKKRRI